MELRCPNCGRTDKVSCWLRQRLHCIATRDPKTGWVNAEAYGSTQDEEYLEGPEKEASTADSLIRLDCDNCKLIWAEPRCVEPARTEAPLDYQI